jgi:hypothetical protein
MASTLPADAGGRIDLAAQPFPDQRAGRFDADDTLAEAEHMRIIR